MDFDFAQEEKAIFKQIDEAIAGFIEGKDELEKRIEVEDAGKLLRELLKSLAPANYLGLMLGDEATPSGSATLMAAMKQLSSYSPSMFLGVEVSTRLCGRALATWASEAQKKRWLEPLTKGETLGALGLSEATSNVVNDPLMTKGEHEGNTVVINGKKGLVINAPIADWIAIAGLLDDGAALFLVSRDAQGLRIGDRLETTSYGGAVFSAVELENCRIPEDHVIGPVKTMELISTLRRWENLILTGASLGLMETAMKAAQKHAKTHKTGEGKPIIKFQEVSFKLAEMLTLVQTSELFAYRAAWACDVGTDDADVLVDCAKVFCSENAEKVTSDALQILGTAAFTEVNPVERAFHSSKLLQVGGTSSEIARVQIGDDALRRWG